MSPHMSFGNFDISAPRSAQELERVLLLRVMVPARDVPLGRRRRNLRSMQLECSTEGRQPGIDVEK